MKLAHFEAFAPVCPVCARAGRGQHRLILAQVFLSARAPESSPDSSVESGILHCSSCRHEYPVLDGIPLIVPDLRRLLSERGLDVLLRDDLNPALESLVGDAIGPESWFDAVRSVLSSHAWDSYADLDPAEFFAPPPDDTPRPGAARRCLSRLLDLSQAADAPDGVAGRKMERIMEVGCGGGRTCFDLAGAHENALVLGLDIHLGVLRLAQRAAAGSVSYPRRRIGLAYDRRRFEVALPGAARVDFWACDALALPFPADVADLCVALNLLDCVPDPRRLLESLRDATRPGGDILLATPYDWATRATPLESWLGGHSQRAPHQGAGEAFLAALLDPGTHAHALENLWWIGEVAGFPWHTRLHDRSTVCYRTHLTALRRA